MIWILLDVIPCILVDIEGNFCYSLQILLEGGGRWKYQFSLELLLLFQTLLHNSPKDIVDFDLRKNIKSHIATLLRIEYKEKNFTTNWNLEDLVLFPTLFHVNSRELSKGSISMPI
jgi:hypothetical protein